MPVQAAQQDFLLANDMNPILNLMDFGPPKTIGKLEKPISSNEYVSESHIMWTSSNRLSLFDLNLELAKYFGQHLFTARPELKSLCKHVTDMLRQAEGIHPLCARTDASIIATKPKNIAELFVPIGP